MFANKWRRLIRSDVARLPAKMKIVDTFISNHRFFVIFSFFYYWLIDCRLKCIAWGGKHWVIIFWFWAGKNCSSKLARKRWKWPFCFDPVKLFGWNIRLEKKSHSASIYKKRKRIQEAIFFVDKKLCFKQLKSANYFRPPIHANMGARWTQKPREGTRWEVFSCSFQTNKFQSKLCARENRNMLEGEGQEKIWKNLAPRWQPHRIFSNGQRGFLLGGRRTVKWQIMAVVKLMWWMLGRWRRPRRFLARSFEGCADPTVVAEAGRGTGRNCHYPPRVANSNMYTHLHISTTVTCQSSKSAFLSICL